MEKPKCQCPACRRVDDLFWIEEDYTRQSRVAQSRGSYDAAAMLDDKSRETQQKIDFHLARCRRLA